METSRARPIPSDLEDDGEQSGENTSDDVGTGVHQSPRSQRDSDSNEYAENFV